MNLPSQRPGLVEGRSIWWRILRASFYAVLLLGIPIGWLCSCGESYFSLTRRLPAEVLVVEGWIGSEGVDAAAAEFDQHGYQYLVATGGLTEKRRDRPNYPEIAEQELIRSGVPVDRIIVAPTGQIERQRTFESAVATWQALERRGLRPHLLNVFTLGPHARRSRLVYEKVYRPGTRVGVIAWVPSDYEAEPWWRSRGRAKCLLKETIGYPFEALLNSGRSSNSPTERGSIDLAQHP
jgi:hypothetical protein